MEKILIIGEEEKAQLLRKKIDNRGFEIEISDGDDDEDFKEYSVIFDLNFDDEMENFPLYARLRDKLIFLSSVKQSLSEASYIYPEKLRSRVFGMNSIPFYLEQETWEISAYRNNEWEYLEKFFAQIKQSFFTVDDRVGMWRPRRDFLSLNETLKLCEEGVIPNYLNNKYVHEEFHQIDKIGVTNLFETLMAIYEDTKEIKYLPCGLLKKKYLRNHKMLK